MKSVILDNSEFTHIFSHYNSIIGFNQESSLPIQLQVKNTHFSHVSICGSVVSSNHKIPTNLTLWSSAVQDLFTHQPTPTITSSSTSQIKITQSTFTYFGLALEYDTDRGPELFQSVYDSLTFSRRATILNLDKFPGEIIIRENQFSYHKLNHHFNLPYDPENVYDIQSSLLSEQKRLLKQAVLLITKSSDGVTLIGNEFKFISTVRGALYIEMPSQYSKGAAILENSFISCLSRFDSAALTLFTSFDSANPQSCSGFFLDSNLFAHGSVFTTQASLVSMSCLLPHITQLDTIESISIQEIRSYTSVNGSVSLSISKPPANPHTYQDTNGQNLEIDYASVSILNSTFSSNFVRAGEGNLMVILFIPNLVLSELGFFRNGDFSLLDSITDAQLFWKDYSGLHLSKISSSFLTLADLNSLFATSLRNDSQLLIYGTQTLSLSNVEINESQSSQKTSTSPMLIQVEEISSFTLENVTISNPLVQYPPEMINYILDNSNLMQSSSLYSWTDTHLFNRPLLEASIQTFQCKNCAFQNITTQAQFINLAANQLIFETSEVTNVYSVPFISSSSELEIVNVTDSSFTSFALSKAFPSSSHFFFSDSSVINLNYLPPATPPSLCSLVAGYQEANITGSNFIQLGGANACVGDFLTTRSNVTLTISSSSFQQIRYEGWADPTSPDHRFLSFNDFSQVRIEDSFFGLIQLGYNQPLIESYYSNLSVNNTQFNTIFGQIFNIEYESFNLNNSRVENNFAHNEKFLLYIQLTQNCYIHHTTFHYNYGGNSLIYLVGTIGARFPQGFQINPLNDATAYPDFYDVTLSENIHNFLIIMRSGASMFMSNITYRANSNYQYRNLPIMVIFSSLLLSNSDFFPQVECQLRAYPNACYFSDEHPALILDGASGEFNNVSFQSFCAQTGLLHLTGCSLIKLDRLNFLNIFGSGILINFQEASLPLVLSNSQFVNIKPRLLVSTSGDIEVVNCTFSNLQNQIFNSRDSLSVISSTFNSVTAPTQELIQCSECSYLNISLSSFHSIRAKHLLRLNNQIDDTVRQESHYSLLENIFQDISITDSGVILIQGLISKQFMISRNQFLSISATDLAQANGVLALHYSDPTSSVSILSNSFQDCHAHVGGGIYYSDMYPVLDLNTFSNVDATSYGDHVASYPVEIVIISNTTALEVRNNDYDEVVSQGKNQQIREMRSGAEIGEHYLAVLDKQGQVVTTVNGQYVNTAITRLNSSLTSNFSEVLTLVNTEEWHKGTLHLNNISFIGHPGFHYSLEMSASSVHLDLSKQDVKTFIAQGNSPSVAIQMQLRTCNAGERFHNTGECQTCEEGSYLLEAVSVPTSCEKCPNYAQCFGGDQIGPSPGYWRPGSHSLSFIPCFNYHACLGSQRDEFLYEGTCQQNYKGILCSQCIKGYTRNTQFQCSKCPNFIFNIILILLILVIVVVVFYFTINCTLNSMTKQKSVFSVYFRLTINHLQILMLVSSFRFDWPPSVQFFFRLAHAVSDPPQQLFSIDCIIQEVSSRFGRFYVYLLLYSIMPIFGILLALIICFIKTPRQVFCDRFIGSILVFIFLIHPAVSRFLFQSFNCYPIEGADRLLEQMSEQCWQGNHLAFAFGVGLPGLLVWVAGLPLYLCFHLREKSQQLKNPSVKRRLGFLYNGYSPRSYYWQILTLAKKDLIAFIAVFLIPQGTQIQSFVLLFVLLCLGFFTFRTMPWNRINLNRLELHSLTALLITVFSGLLFLSQSDPGTPYFQTGKDFVLHQYSKWILFVFIFVANISFLINIGWNAFSDTRSSIRRKCAKFYVCCCLCGDRKIYKEEVKDEKIRDQNYEKLQQIDQVSQMLDKIRGKYERGEQFVHQKKFEDFLPQLLQLNKILLFKENNLIGARIYRQSMKGMIRTGRESPQDCPVNLEFFENDSQDVLNLEFEDSPPHKSKVNSPRKFKVEAFESLSKESSSKSKDLTQSSSSQKFPASRTRPIPDFQEVELQNVLQFSEFDIQYQEQREFASTTGALPRRKIPKQEDRSPRRKVEQNSRRNSILTLQRSSPELGDRIFDELNQNLKVETSEDNRMEIIMEEEERKEPIDQTQGKAPKEKKVYETLRKDRRSIRQSQYFQSEPQKEDTEPELKISVSLFSSKIQNHMQKTTKKKKLFSEKDVSSKSKDPITLGLNRI